MNQTAFTLTDEEFESLRTNGVKVNYYAICPRKLWLFSHHICLEQDSDRVTLGRLLHQQSYREQTRRELLIDNLIKVDLLEKQGKLLEVKYSRKLKEAARLQVLYYLYYLHRRGMTNLEGELRFPKERRREIVSLDQKGIRAVEKALKEIAKINALDSPPKVEFMSICRSCAYLELCWG